MWSPPTSKGWPADTTKAGRKMHAALRTNKSASRKEAQQKAAAKKTSK